MNDKIQTKAELEVEFTADGLLHHRVVVAAGLAIQEATRDHKRASNRSQTERLRVALESCGKAVHAMCKQPGIGALALDEWSANAFHRRLRLS
jgi:hypothetical protein